MNKDFEKLKKVIFSTEEQNIDGTIYISKEQIKCLMLEDKVEKLQERIDKAIEQLEELKNLYDDNYTVSDKAENILDILKGGNNDK